MEQKKIQRTSSLLLITVILTACSFSSNVSPAVPTQSQAIETQPPQATATEVATEVATEPPTAAESPTAALTQGACISAIYPVVEGATWTYKSTGSPAGDYSYTDTDRKSTRLNSSHGYISYAVFCLKK